MRTKQVHWAEGMLLLPHHLQAAQAHLQDCLSASQNWMLPYAYGLRAFELNVEALKDFQCRVPRLTARLRDGTLVSVPENAQLSVLDLKPAFEARTEAYLHLTLPEITIGRANAGPNGESENVRFVLEQEEWDDRYSGGASQWIVTHRLNARLQALPTLEGPSGFESLPIAKLVRAQSGAAAPELDRSYIPPLLACEFWPELREGVIATVCAWLGAFIKREAEYLRTVGGWNEAGQPQIRKRITKLNAVNAAYPTLVQLSAASGIHPLAAYLELCRLVGQLSLFRPNWQPPDLPRYDHDDLGRIFAAVLRELELLLADERESEKWQRFEFIGVRGVKSSEGKSVDWLEVALDPRWLQDRHDFFIAVKSDLPARQLEAVFTPHWLDFKSGSSRRIATIFRDAERGLKLDRVAGVHPVLPPIRDVTFYQVDQSGRYWNEVIQSRTLALIFNRNYVARDFVGQNTIVIVDPDDVQRDLTFHLYVVER